MHANELRLGNWYSNGTNNYKLGTSDFMDYLNEAQVNKLVIRNIEPIQLTPEILDKCTSTLKDNGFEHDWSKSGRLGISIHGSIVTTIDYLHEYQNLYFAILGSELTVNL